MKRQVLLLLLVILFISGCDGEIVRKAPLSALEQEVRANAGASIPDEGLKTCADIVHPNCVELNSCGDYSSYSDTYFLLMQK